MWKRKREHEEQWEETRDQRVCFLSFSIFIKIFFFFMTITNLIPVAIILGNTKHFDAEINHLS